MVMTSIITSVWFLMSTFQTCASAKKQSCDASCVIKDRTAFTPEFGSRRTLYFVSLDEHFLWYRTT